MARYRPSDTQDFLAALKFLNRAKEQNFDVSLSKYYPPRTNPQNSYLHFVLSFFAHNYGCTLIEAKEIYLKKYAAPEIFRRTTETKHGTDTYYRSTADLSTAEMSSAIRNFIEYASMNDIEIPPPEYEAEVRKLEQEMQSTAALR